MTTANPLVTTSTFVPITGTIQLYANGVALGSPFATGISAPTEIFSTAGTYAITASYSGDANWQPTTSSAINLTVTSTPATFQISESAKTLALAAGVTSGNVDQVSVVGLSGFNGPVNLSCAVAYAGTGTASGIPTCSFSTNSVTLAPSEAGVYTTLSINSVGAQTVPALRAAGGDLRGGWGYSGGVGFCALMLWLVPRRRGAWRGLVAALVVAAGFGALSGCGGSSGSSGPSGPVATPTTKGSYTVTITASTTAPLETAPAPITLALTID